MVRDLRELSCSMRGTAPLGENGVPVAPGSTGATGLRPVRFLRTNGDGWADLIFRFGLCNAGRSAATQNSGEGYKLFLRGARISLQKQFKKGAIDLIGEWSDGSRNKQAATLSIPLSRIPRASVFYV